VSDDILGDFERFERWWLSIKPAERMAVITPDVPPEVRAKLNKIGYRLIEVPAEQIAQLPHADRPVIGNGVLAAMFGIPVFDGSTVLPDDLFDGPEGSP
jgi:hypothetical protein